MKELKFSQVAVLFDKEELISRQVFFILFIKLTVIFISRFVKTFKVSRNTFVIVAYEKVFACNRVAMENWPKAMPKHYNIKNVEDMPSTLKFV